MQLFREGYARSLSQERIAWAMEQNPLLIIIDTRKSPKGRRGFAKDDSFYVGSKPVKNGEKIPPNAELVQGLENQWGPDRYKYAGDYLGNRNYYIDGAPHDIVDMATGMKGMKWYLDRGFPLLLLCVCATWSGDPDEPRCHTYDILDECRVQFEGVEVYELCEVVPEVLRGK